MTKPTTELRKTNFYVLNLIGPSILSLSLPLTGWGVFFCNSVNFEVWLWHKLIALQSLSTFTWLYVNDKESTGICVLNMTFVTVSILLKNRPTKRRNSQTAALWYIINYLFIYYDRWQHKLKHTDKTQYKHKHKTLQRPTKEESTNELQLAGNKELGKYLN